MKNALNILTIIHKDMIEKVVREEDKKYLKRFFYIYLIFFIFSCILLLWTFYPFFCFFVFLPFLIAFNPIFENYKIGLKLIKFKEFHLLFIFSCVFSIFIFLLANSDGFW